MRILWIDPIGTEAYAKDTLDILKKARFPGTQVDFICLPQGRPTYLEYQAYEALVIGDIVRICHREAVNYDAFVLGCFFDIGLYEVREISGSAVVAAPCESSVGLALSLANRVAILVGRRKWIPRIRDNLRRYGFDQAVVSIRAANIDVAQFQDNPKASCDALIEEGRLAVEVDGAEVLVLGCTAAYGFNQAMQERLGIPVIDATIAPFKFAELRGELAREYGWVPSRKWSGEPPPGDEFDRFADVNSNSNLGQKFSGDA